MRPEDAGQTLAAATVRLQALAAESLAGAGHTMLDLARALRAGGGAPASVETLGSQARKPGFLEL